MADPPALSTSLDSDDHGNDRDPDADIEGAQDSTVLHAQDVSSSTLDHETQPADNQAPLPSAQHNRKDATLREFLSKMDDYAPISYLIPTIDPIAIVQIPDAVTAHYLTVSGLPPPSPQDPTGVTTNTTPLPLARLLALATQKFIADIAADAYQYSRIRSSNTAAANNPLGGALGVGLPAAPGAVAAAGAGGGGAKGQQTQLGVQRAGYGGGGQGGSGQGRTVLTMEDLGMAVGEYGVNVKRGEFYR